MLGAGVVATIRRQAVSKPKVLFAAALAVAASVATLAMPAPASADAVDSVHVACTAQGNLTMEGDALYRVLGPETREWFEFRYILYGDMGKKSNVDIRLYENGALVMALLSPDDRRAGRQYVVHPAKPAPQTGFFDVEVSFEAIFDKFGYDPRCLANNVLPPLP
jgi:hypothetical protein